MSARSRPHKGCRERLARQLKVVKPDATKVRLGPFRASFPQPGAHPRTGSRPALARAVDSAVVLRPARAYGQAEVDALLQAGTDRGLFAQTLLQQRSDQTAKNALADIQDKHRDILRLEQARPLQRNRRISPRLTPPPSTPRVPARA